MGDMMDLEILENEARAVALAIHCWDSKAVMDALHLGQREAAGRALTAVAEKMHERFGDEELEIGPFLSEDVKFGSEPDAIPSS